MCKFKKMSVIEQLMKVLWVSIGAAGVYVTSKLITSVCHNLDADTEYKKLICMAAQSQLRDLQTQQPPPQQQQSTTSNFFTTVD